MLLLAVLSHTRSCFLPPPLLLATCRLLLLAPARAVFDFVRLSSRDKGLATQAEREAAAKRMREVGASSQGALSARQRQQQQQG